MSRLFKAGCTLLLLGSLPVAGAQGAPDAALAEIGRAATSAEIKAWDIDVRPDFTGLPDGKGDVTFGEQVWEKKCTSCHGTFGESNEVFTPLVGGTTAEDIRSGRVENLAREGYPHRTTLMKASHLSSLWDYIYRAMPWTEPKSLTSDEVYGVLAYILNLGDIVPSDFTLSQENMAEVQERLPNRRGKVFFRPMWDVQGSGDVTNPACMKDCPVESTAIVSFPEAARNTHGNIADQVRGFGAARGTDTSSLPRTAASGESATASRPLMSSFAAAAPPTDAVALVKAKACTACHGIDQKIVGPGFKDVARKYHDKPEAVDYLVGKILKGGQGVWGSVPMPAQVQVKEDEARTMATWLAGGAK